MKFKYNVFFLNKRHIVTLFNLPLTQGKIAKIITTVLMQESIVINNESEKHKVSGNFKCEQNKT